MFKREFHIVNREKDLRKAFDDFILGKSGGIKHAHKILIRRARLDKDGNALKCKCVDFLTNEAAVESSCNYCLGEKFIWDEGFEETYSMLKDSTLSSKIRKKEFGEVRVEYRTFYFRYDTKISYNDKIIMLKLDLEGNVLIPYKREIVYRPETIQVYRSDFGRVEYIAVHCREDQAIRLER